MKKTTLPIVSLLALSALAGCRGTSERISILEMTDISEVPANGENLYAKAANDYQFKKDLNAKIAGGFDKLNSIDLEVTTINRQLTHGKDTGNGVFNKLVNKTMFYEDGLSTHHSSSYGTYQNYDFIESNANTVDVEGYYDAAKTRLYSSVVENQGFDNYSITNGMDEETFTTERDTQRLQLGQNALDTFSNLTPSTTSFPSGYVSTSSVNYAAYQVNDTQIFYGLQRTVATEIKIDYGLDIKMALADEKMLFGALLEADADGVYSFTELRVFYELSTNFYGSGIVMVYDEMVTTNTIEGTVKFGTGTLGKSPSSDTFVSSFPKAYIGDFSTHLLYRPDAVYDETGNVTDLGSSLEHSSYAYSDIYDKTDGVVKLVDRAVIDGGTPLMNARGEAQLFVLDESNPDAPKYVASTYIFQIPLDQENTPVAMNYTTFDESVYFSPVEEFDGYLEIDLAIDEENSIKGTLRLVPDTGNF